RQLLQVELRLAVEDLEPAAHADERAGGHGSVDPLGVVPDAALERAAPVAQLDAQVRLVLAGPPELPGLDVIAAGHAGALPQVLDGRPRERIAGEPLADGGAAARPAR